MLDENIYELMKHSFGGSVYTIYVPSLKRSIPFKEPTVRENKLISKIVIANKESQSIVYAASLALIKGLCVDKSFDQYSITEYDRLTILATLFSNNFISKQIGLKCPKDECKHQFVYSVKHGDLLKSIESLDVSDVVFQNKNSEGDITIKLNYPTTKQYLDFLEFIDADNEKSEHEDLVKDKVPRKANDRYSELNSAFSEIEAMQESSGADGKSSADIQDIKIAEMINKRKAQSKAKMMEKSIAGNIDVAKAANGYTMLDVGDLYITDIMYHINGDEHDYHIVFDNSINFIDREKILGMFPMSFLTMEDGTTLLEYSTTEFDKRTKGCVPTIVCPKCGTVISDAIGIQDFFIRG